MATLTVEEMNRRTLKMIDPRNYVDAMKSAMNVVRNEEATFPPQPSRTRAKTFNTWVREIGRLPKSAFVTQSGARRKRIITGVVLKASDQMLRQWKEMPMVVALTGAGLVGVGVNRARYSGYVQGEKQASFHAVTGWLTTVQATDRHRQEIMGKFLDRAKQILNGR